MAKSNDSIDNAVRKRKIIALTSLTIFALLVAIATCFVAQKLDKLSSDPLLFKNWIQSFGFWGKLVFVCLASVQVLLVAVPGGPVQIAAGYAFGIVEGTILCVIGIQIGSTIAFLLARYLGTRVLDLFFSHKEIESVSFFQKIKRLDVLVFICFLIPGAPKDLLTYFCGMTKLSFKKFILITTFARLPSIIISVISGNAILEQEYTLAIIVLASLAICSVAGFWIYKALTSQKKSNVR